MLYLILDIILIIVIFFMRKSAYYGKVFSENHYNEICVWLQEIVKMHETPDAPSIDNNTALLTSEKIALAYTSTIVADSQNITISVSQGGGYTTSALGRRILYLVDQLFDGAPTEKVFYRTQSTVHYIALKIPLNTTITDNAVTSAVQSMASFQHFEVQEVQVPN